MPFIFKKKIEPFLERTVVIKSSTTKLIQKTNENAINCSIMVPKWVVGLSVIAFAFIFTVFIAAIAIVYAAPRPGLYGESCATRSCLKGFDLKCINGVCLCPGQDYYYGIKCTPKRNYMETCSRTVPCKNGSNLVCRNGKCDCNTTNYWNGTYCEIKESYKGHCNSDKGCQYNLLLYCNQTTKTCLCDSSHYWDGTACTKKRSYLETCQLSTDCIDSQHTICSNKTCSCLSTKYWDSLYSTCRDYIYENNSCVSSSECFSPMNCTGGLCKCGSYQYHNTTNLQCVNQSYLNGTCVIDYHCRIDKGFQCKFGICQCISTKPFWTNFSSICIKPYTYTQDCNVTYECDQSLNLICNDATTSCNCPTSICSGKCDCKRVAGDEWYWNGASCVPAGAVNQACTPFVNYTCQTLTQKSSCNSSGICTCGTNGGLKSNGKCASCETGWTYINEYCYRLGTIESNSSINATDYFIHDSCQAQNLVSYTARASVKLAVLSNVNVRRFFRNNGNPLKGYFVDAHLDLCGSNPCYVSTNGSLWNTNPTIWNITYTGPSSQWCQPATFKDCVYYNSSYDCFTDYCCVTSDCALTENKLHACQYTADEN